MKRVTDLIKPNILLIFGAILLLCFMNNLAGTGGALAIGIVAVIFAAYYIGIGIVGVVAGNKLGGGAKKVIDAISVSLFPIFLFVITLIDVINYADRMGPTGWVIQIFTMIASLAVVVMYLVYKFSGNNGLQSFVFLFVALFALALLLNILFDFSGAPNELGEISILGTVLYGLFVFYLFNSLSSGKDAPAPKEAKEEPKEEKAEEPAPEEAPAE